MKQPLTYSSGKVIDHIDEIMEALKRQDTVTWYDIKLNKPALVVEAQNSQGRHDVMIPDGVGHSNIANKAIFDGLFILKIGQLYVTP